MKRIQYAVAVALALCGCDNTPGYDATGIFEATTVTVSAETSGKILSLGPEEGDSVSQGERIAVIDTVLLSLQRRQLESRRLSAESSSPDVAVQASALRTKIAHQRHECERLGRLLADGATTRKQFDDAQVQLDMLEGQLSALLSTLGKNRSSISDNALAIMYQAEEVAELIAKSTIVSPVAGTVLVRYAEPGEFATTGRPLCKIADLDKQGWRMKFI